MKCAILPIGSSKPWIVERKPVPADWNPFELPAEVD